MRQPPDELGAIARRWFEAMRECGDDVRELLHDGHPTACAGDAAFAYINAFKAHDMQLIDDDVGGRDLNAGEPSRGLLF